MDFPLDFGPTKIVYESVGALHDEEAEDEAAKSASTLSKMVTIRSSLEDFDCDLEYIFGTINWGQGVEVGRRGPENPIYYCTAPYYFKL